jgi:hypothetical protein
MPPTLPAVKRAWYPTQQASQALGLSPRTLRRYVARDHWIEGVHYRWVSRLARRTLEINIPLAARLMEQQGWG